MTVFSGLRQNLVRGLAAIALPVALLAAPAQAEENRFGGYEVRAGVLSHDAGLFSSAKEDGVDINAQVLFPSPKFLKAIGSPRPAVGGSVATNGISQVFAVLVWDWNMTDKFFLSGELGGALHNADRLDPPAGGDIPGERYLGCQVLFRLAVGAGYRINERLSVQLYADHISNATSCSSNEGLENAGVRIGYRF